MSDPDRLKVAIARGARGALDDFTKAFNRALAALDSCKPGCGCDTPRADHPMKVKDLHAVLAEHIAHGRGDDDLYLYPSDNIEADDPGFMSTWGQQHNYQIVYFGWTDDADHFVTLTFDRDREES